MRLKIMCKKTQICARIKKNACDDKQIYFRPTPKLCNRYGNSWTRRRQNVQGQQNGVVLIYVLTCWLCVENCRLMIWCQCHQIVIIVLMYEPFIHHVHHAAFGCFILVFLKFEISLYPFCFLIISDVSHLFYFICI